MGTLNLKDPLYAEEYSLDSINFFNFNSQSPPLLSQDSGFTNSSSSSRSSHHNHQGFVDSPAYSFNPYYNTTSSKQTISCLEANSFCSDFSPGAVDGDSFEAPDFSDACIKYLSDILMEEDLDGETATIQDYKALQETEKQLYDAIGETYLPSTQFISQDTAGVQGQVDAARVRGHNFNTGGGANSYRVNAFQSMNCGLNSFDSNWLLKGLESCIPAAAPTTDSSLESSSPSSVSAGSADGTTAEVGGLNESSLGGPFDPEIERGNLQWIEKAVANFINMGNPDFNGLVNHQESNQRITSVEIPVRSEIQGRSSSAVDESRGRKSRPRDDADSVDVRNNKHLEAYSEEELMGQYDDVLLHCRGGTEDNTLATKQGQPMDFSGRSQRSEKPKGGSSRNRGSRNKKQGSATTPATSVEDVVDLFALLTQCAQAVASFDLRTAHELLRKIRQHSSPTGDGIQRVTHYFADGLEARLAGTASQQYTGMVNVKISSSQFMKAYRTYVKAVPFKRMSYFLANKTIGKLSADVKKIHVIDFGIWFGIQWPCFIQHLSKRKNGAPQLRFTAVDYPQRGYQPAARVEESVRRLAAYSKRFGVPFESHIIAQKWETLRPEDFTLEEDELLVVNCLYRSRTLLDDTVEVDSPRDAFLKLVRNLNPALFIHGIINGTHNAPFFTTRFREAMFHYSSFFDMFDTTLPRDEDDRQLVEREIYGKDILNVVASEGTERVERPETYKQWTARNLRIGFKQVPLHRDLVSSAKAMVKAHYHKDFVVDEDNNWMLQGWKGRLLCAISCWKPAYG